MGCQQEYLKDNNSEKKQGGQLIPSEYFGQITLKFGYYPDGLLKHSSLMVQEKAFVLPVCSLENEYWLEMSSLNSLIAQSVSKVNANPS